MTRQMTDQNLYKLLESHLPANAVHYGYDLWADHQFNFKVTKSRSSKYGDYRYSARSGQHSITVNGDLNVYAFLVTYLHEVAHLLTYKTNPRIALPHGKEWKANFRKLMLPMLSDLVFPKDILDPLAHHMKNPKATSSADHVLSAALRKYDAQTGLVHLGEINLGVVFRLNKRVFKTESKKRTRIVCEEVKSGRKYLISKIALVDIVTDNSQASYNSIAASPEAKKSLF